MITVKKRRATFAVQEKQEDYAKKVIESLYGNPIFGSVKDVGE